MGCISKPFPSTSLFPDKIWEVLFISEGKEANKGSISTYLKSAWGGVTQHGEHDTPPAPAAPIEGGGAGCVFNATLILWRAGPWCKSKAAPASTARPDRSTPAEPWTEFTPPPLTPTPTPRAPDVPRQKAKAREKNHCSPQLRPEQRHTRTQLHPRSKERSWTGL